MWLCSIEGFYSIVAKDCGPTELLVRARRDGDIEKLWPTAKVINSTGTDYAFRAVLPRKVVAKAIAKEAMRIDYDNFKSSVTDEALHNAYFRVWDAMATIQTSHTTNPADRRRQKPA
jgi:hypothetical protein